MLEYQLRVQAIVCADDDGTGGVGVRASEVASGLARANEIFAIANIKLVYDEAKDFLKINSTLHNRDLTVLEPPKPNGKWDHNPLTDTKSHSLARDALARQFPRKLVIFFHNRQQIKQETVKNPDDEDTQTGLWILTGRGNSSGSTDFYVSMTGDTDGNNLAHEIGHYLQLPHTFDVVSETVAAAAEEIKKYVAAGNPRGKGLDVFDGDRNVFTDTPPDAKGEIFVNVHGDKCGPNGTILIGVNFSGAGFLYTLAPNRSLVMSYFKGCPGPKTFSPQQVRRMRDGLELRLRNNLISTRPRFSYQLKTGDSKGAGEINSLDIAQVRAGRVVTAVTVGGGHLKLIVWDIAETNGQITRRGDAQDEIPARVALCSIGNNMIATAICTFSNRLKVLLWRIEDNGSITQTDAKELADLPAVDVSAAVIHYGLTSNSFATAVCRHDNDGLQVDVWQVSATGTLQHTTTDFNTGPYNTPLDGFVRPRVNISSVGGQSVVTCVRDKFNLLKAILWRYSDGKLDPIDSTFLAEAPVGAIAACGVARDTAVAAVQDKNKKLKLVAYGFPEDARFIERRGMAEAGDIQDVRICRLGTEMVVTGVRGSGNKLKLILWRVTEGGHRIARWHDLTTDDSFHESATRLAMCQTGPNQFVTAIRDRDGKLKLSSWRGSALGALGPLDEDISIKLAASQDATAPEDDCEVENS